MKGRSAVLIAGLLCSLWLGPMSLAQNVIGDSAPGTVLAPLTINEVQATELVRRAPKFGGGVRGKDAARLATRLDAHVRQFLDGAPWKPFQHTLGISGYEVYYDHSDDEFHALALALPWLPSATAERVTKFLESELERHPPYALNGLDRIAGNPRESYTVPDALRIGGEGQARSAFGVYAFWAWCHVTKDPSATQRPHWEAVKARMQPLLAKADYPFDPARRNYEHDEAEKLNGDLAGLLATARLARMNADEETGKLATARLARLLELRVNLERTNERMLEKTRTINRTLHVFKLARYCALTPEIGDAVARLSEGCGARRLAAFREMRNGWFLAYGDRFVGGENYTSPSHFSRGLFLGTVLFEKLPPEQLSGFVDVPWCKGDFAFMEKCALALWASEGGGWEKLR